MDELIISPEKEELRNHLRLLQKEVAELVSIKDSLLSHEGPALSAQYLEAVGSLQYDLFVLQTEVKKLQLEISLIQSYINKNSAIDFQQVTEKVKKAAEAYQKIIEEKAEQLKAAKELLSMPILSEEEKHQLVELYHAIVKKLHPDIHPHPTEKEKELFVQAQNAYKSGDLESLKVIATQINSNDEIPQKTDFLQKEIKHLQKICDKLKKDIEALENQFPFTQRRFLGDPFKIEEKRNELNHLIDNAKRQKEEYQKYVNALKLWKPGLLN